MQMCWCDDTLTDDCLYPPHILHSYITEGSGENYVIYHCEQGYMFETGELMKSSRCQDDNSWSLDDEQCICM